MIADIRQAIVNRLRELYPDHKRYVDDIPQDFKKPSFVVFQIDQDYSKRLNTKYNGRISFDVAYFSDKPKQDVKTDCFAVQEALMREFDTFGAFRAINKNARITDNVLHMTFDVNYSEMKVEDQTPMQTQTTNTNL